MSERPQVSEACDETKPIEQLAAGHTSSLEKSIPQAAREASPHTQNASAENRIAAVRQALANSFPTADIEQTNREIAQGYKS
jgi:hypothetical protein